MNMQAILKQAQSLQKDMMKAKDEVDSMLSGYVSVNVVEQMIKDAINKIGDINEITFK